MDSANGVSNYASIVSRFVLLLMNHKKKKLLNDKTH